jgi:hypothetical protein
MTQEHAAADPPDRLGAWWYGIGDRPSDSDLRTAAGRYQVVVLNAWETAAMRRLRELNPKVTVLVYKDLSSTRSYPGAVDGGKDAAKLPTGVGYIEAGGRWFARDTRLRHIEWAPDFPQHWQMAVWNRGYQQQWVHNVVKEVVAEGWDGVLADNDFYSLRWYSPAVIAGTVNQDGTDRLLREGLDRLTAVAGKALADAGKQFVPNISEPHLQTGRLAQHARFTGAMDENFMMRNNDGLLSFQGSTFDELRAAALAGKQLLLMTRATDDVDRRIRVGYAGAALLGGDRTYLAVSTTDDYSVPGWSSYQNLRLGKPTSALAGSGQRVWTRTFTHGWVALNSGSLPVKVIAPPGLCDVYGRPAPTNQTVPPRDAVVLTTACHG